MATDRFGNLTPGLDSPIEDAEATAFGQDYAGGVTRGLLLEEDGKVEVITKGGTTITLSLVKGLNPIRVSQCKSAPVLTADKIWGLF